MLPLTYFFYLAPFLPAKNFPGDLKLSLCHEPRLRDLPFPLRHMITIIKNGISFTVYEELNSLVLALIRTSIDTEPVWVFLG